jgi:hypothetical protein
MQTQRRSRLSKKWGTTVWRRRPAGQNTGGKPVLHPCQPAGRAHAPRLVPESGRRPAFLLLETVIATGLLILALAVIGIQVQKSHFAIRDMVRESRAIPLAEQFLAEMDLGLVELDSLNNVEEGDFGPRFPDWGWRMVIERTSIDDMFLLQIEILYHRREDSYRQNSFEYAAAEVVQRLYAMRAMPERVDFALDFGLNEEEVTELADRMAEAGLPDFDPSSFNLRDFFGNTPSEELMKQLPLLMDKFGFELEDVASFIPPELLEELKGMGLFGEPESEGDGQGDGEP